MALSCMTWTILRWSTKMTSSTTHSVFKPSILMQLHIDDPFDFTVCMDFLEFKGKLGEGGFGQVYLAWDSLNKRKVAVKILNSSDHPFTPQLMNKEIEALAKLKHKHIVKMYNSFPLPKKQQIILVMEYLEGGELYNYWSKKEGRIVSENEAKEIMLQLLSAIDYCHNLKIIHRDLKFQNILLSRKPEASKVTVDEQTGRQKINEFDIDLRVVDFGIFGSTSGINPEKVQAGSLKYMAPELLIGHTESSAAIDVWSLGIILHGLVLGFLPFRNSNKDDLKKKIIEQQIKFSKEHRISTACKDLIKRMLDKDPTKRITVSEIMVHQWISKYKDQKMKREWGYSDSDDSLVIEEENQDTQQEVKANEIVIPSDSQPINEQSTFVQSSPYGKRDIDMLPLPDHLMRSLQKFNADTTNQQMFGTIKHSSDLNLRKKKTTVEGMKKLLRKLRIYINHSVLTWQTYLGVKSMFLRISQRLRLALK